jgi:integrase/recombinase XerC
MNDISVVASDASATDAQIDAGQRLYEAFLAGRLDATRAAYTGDMDVFAKFLGVDSPREALTQLLSLTSGAANAKLLAFKVTMIEAKLTPATINRRLSAVRSAVKLGRILGLTDWVPEVASLKSQSFRDTRGPGIDGTRAMLAVAQKQEGATAPRDAAIIRLFFDLGLRRAEVIRLDVSDIDFDGRRVWILGKGRSQKECRTLPEKTMYALLVWIAARAKIVATDESALFVALDRNSQGRRISGRGVYYVISGLGDDAGIKTRPHGLRHASITAALDLNNGDIRAVQQHARHANPATTMKYDDNRKDLAGMIASDLSTVL